MKCVKGYALLSLGCKAIQGFLKGTSCIVLLSAGMYGCKSTPKAQDKPAEVKRQQQGLQEEAIDLDIGLSASADRKSFTHSFSNNPFTSKVWNWKKYASAARKIEKKWRQDKKNLQLLVNLIGAERLARVSIAKLLRRLHTLGKLVKEKSLGDNIPEEAFLEVGIAALEQNQPGLANTLLDKLTVSKNSRIRAGAFNALGVQALREDRTAEAVRNWKEAIKVVPNYEASMLNLGMISLKHGRFEDARSYLGVVSDDWFAQSGILVASRLMGDLEVTAELCRVLVKKHPKHMPIHFNCGIHEWQSNQDKNKAKQLINQALDMKVGPQAWSNHAFRVLDEIAKK
ncbi:MAG: hypothetical protein OXT67_06155 [Zetaproteobacteria bacterium]|nr:hypothetical protein [Zetaproteobacteria bacterium]